MAYQVSILPAALRQLAKLPRPVQKRIQEQIDTLADNPRPHGVKALEGRQGFIVSAQETTASSIRLRRKGSLSWWFGSDTGGKSTAGSKAGADKLPVPPDGIEFLMLHGAHVPPEGQAQIPGGDFDVLLQAAVARDQIISAWLQKLLLQRLPCFRREPEFDAFQLRNDLGGFRHQFQVKSPLAIQFFFPEKRRLIGFLQLFSDRKSVV